MPHKDPEVRKAYHRAYHASHREQVSAQHSVWYEANKEGRRAYSRRWFAENRDAAIRYRLNRRLRYPWRHLLKAALERAAKKGVPFSLTEEWAASRWTGRCEVTGIEFLPNGRGTGPKPRSPSIDRKNPKLGYTPDNCRFILACVNSFKHEGTEDEMIDVAIAIVRALRPRMLRP